jgi:D-alanyl-D-alanine carboxypeptidase/D-alanyl-D-alanine-endopeptidase (penicillin-binding protein 4)
MRKYLLFILFCFTSFQTLSAQQSPVDHLFSTESLKTASYSIYAIDANTGSKIVESSQKSLSTASVMKLFTTAVSLEILGPDYTFSTTLSYAGNINSQTNTLNGNLILKGGGDPAFYSSFFADHYKNCFENWIDELKKRGIKKINGNLMIDLSSLQHASIPGDWGWEDIGNYYGAGISTLTFGDNLYNIHFSSSKTVGSEATIKFIDPEIKDLLLENLVLASAEAGDNTIVYGAPGSVNQTIQGTIPAGETDFVVKAAIPDPPLVAGLTFIKKLKEAGIEISGVVSKAGAAETNFGTLISSQMSPPLKDLIVPLNKESLNLFAEHLLCEIGRKSYNEPTIEKGIEAYHQFCRNKGIDSKGFFPTDGSGLSRSNALTSKTLVETLRIMYDSKYRSIFFGALPVAGVDGTLRHSFKGTPLEKNVMAKTGSMARVRSIAGMMKTKSKKTVLFAIILNNFDLKSAEASKLLESILLSLYND